MTSLKNLKNLLFYLFIFLLPTQLGKHFFPDFSYIDGIRIDFLDPTLYLTDVIAVIILFAFYKKIVLPKTKILAILLILFIVNITFSLSPFVTMYRSFMYLEVILLYVIFLISVLSHKLFLWSVFLSSILQIIIATLQITTEGSIQGIFYFLGERYFTISAPGIAKAVVNGVEFLRPYGTFSHPNSLAGFFLLVHTFFLWNKNFKNYPLLKNLVLATSAILVLLSFSKITITILALMYVAYGFKNYKACRVCSIGKALTMILIAGLFMMTTGDPDTLQKRVLLATHSIQIIASHVLTGVGLGNYVLTESRFPNPYPYVFIEPVHNIFLLFLAETGIIMTLFTGVIILPFLKKLWQNESARYVLIVVIITGFFDHYWLTLQQNLLLMPVLFGLLSQQTVSPNGKKWYH